MACSLLRVRGAGPSGNDFGGEGVGGVFKGRVVGYLFKTSFVRIHSSVKQAAVDSLGGKNGRWMFCRKAKYEKGSGR